MAIVVVWRQLDWELLTLLVFINRMLINRQELGNGVMKILFSIRMVRSMLMLIYMASD